MLNNNLPNGAWDQYTADNNHSHSPKFAEWLSNYLDKDKVIMDFGCGTGYYLNYLSEKNFNHLIGIDGYALNNFEHHNVFVKDLSQPFDLLHIGNVICLEVGEHIPEEFEQTFIDNICKHADKLILSWATPNQPGVGHINCKTQEYIKSQIEERGFKYLADKTKEARNNTDKICDWLTRNVMVFEFN